jgi:hypothetical protein
MLSLATSQWKFVIETADSDFTGFTKLVAKQYKKNVLLIQSTRKKLPTYLNVLCSDESDLPKQMIFNRREKKNLANSRELGGIMNFTKYTPQQSREFNSKILAWPGAEGDREEGNEDESGQSRSTFKQTEKCWVILKESKRIFLRKSCGK